MNYAAANLLAAAILAAALLIAQHWELGPAINAGYAIRLNRWTGAIQYCQLQTDYTYRCPAGD